jgi:hypothetical protein
LAEQAFASIERLLDSGLERMPGHVEGLEKSIQECMGRLVAIEGNATSKQERRAACISKGVLRAKRLVYFRASQ